MKKLFSLILLLPLSYIGFTQTLEVSYSPDIFKEAFSGRVVVYLSKDQKEPKDQGIGFVTFPCFALDVTNIEPGESVIFDDKAISFPTSLSNIERGTYYIQAVWDRNLGGRAIAQSPGNLYNTSQTITLTKNYDAVFEVVANTMVPEKEPFIENDYVKAIDVPSTLLSDFHGQDFSLKAAVLLPEVYYSEPKKEFPVLYRVYGYGGDYMFMSGRKDPAELLDDIPVIQVILDGNCALGHSVYANSDNNGPWGDALTQELIPAIEKRFRGNGTRLLRGHSSGGWTVLWLQTQYPKVFHGTWSSAPDPVDFENFQRINIYEDSNMFYDAKGDMRLVSTVAGAIPWGYMKTIYNLEYVVYRGEQMRSFDAVFSGKDANGWPYSICNVETGKIDPEVVKQWSRYDITKYLLEQWDNIKEDLQGKVRVSVGNQDNFLLNHAVRSMDEKIKALQTGFEFAYYPGDHFTVFRLDDYVPDATAFLKQKLLEHENNTN